MKSATMGVTATIEVVIADHKELFQIGMAEVFAAAGELRVVGHEESLTQLLNTLERAKPHVFILSTSFLAAFPMIKQILERRQTALLLLAEGNDQTDYMQWLLRAHGIVHRSVDEAALVVALRRPVRGEFFVQNNCSDIREDKSDVA